MTQLLHVVFAAQGFDLGKPLSGGSERMPSDFFRMSRCSRSRSTSSRNAAFSRANSSGDRAGAAAPGGRVLLPQAYSRSARIPSSLAISAALRPLVRHSSTASCRYCSVNLRRRVAPPELNCVIGRLSFLSPTRVRQTGATSVFGLSCLLFFQSLTLLAVIIFTSLSSRSSVPFIPGVHSSVFVARATDLLPNEDL